MELLCSFVGDFGGHLLSEIGSCNSGKLQSITVCFICNKKILIKLSQSVGVSIYDLQSIM